MHRSAGTLGVRLFRHGRFVPPFFTTDRCTADCHAGPFDIAVRAVLASHTGRLAVPDGPYGIVRWHGVAAPDGFVNKSNQGPPWPPTAPFGRESRSAAAPGPFPARCWRWCRVAAGVRLRKRLVAVWLRSRPLGPACHLTTTLRAFTVPLAYTSFTMLMPRFIAGWRVPLRL